MKTKNKECCDWFKIQERILDDIFDIANDIHGWSICQFSSHSGLAWSTIERIRNKDTKYPQFRTIILLARSVGMNVSVVTKQLKKVKAA